MRWAVLCAISFSLLEAAAEACDLHLSEECDASPLLQLTRRSPSPPESLGSAVLERLKKLTGKFDFTATRTATIANSSSAGTTYSKAKSKEWPFAPNDPNNEPQLPKEPLTDEQKKVRRKVLARQAVTAAGLIMALMTFSVGMQLIMVEFVMTGTCAMPFNIAGMMVTVILGVIAGFRYLFRVPYRLLRGFCQQSGAMLCGICCCGRQQPKAVLPLSQLCPEHLLEEVIGFLPMESLSALSSTSRKMNELAHSSSAVPALLDKVQALNLQKRWQRHLERLEEASIVSESSESVDQASVRTSSPEPSQEEKAVHGTAVIKELHRFLCRHMRRSAEKENAHEMQEQWNVITDFVRYVMLVIGWFWFSAEVMDMACSEEATGAFHILKAISSPAIFLFILESDRSQFWWQVVAGLCAFMLLMDLLFDSFRPLK